nr:immunoglobulin light chain junction region [Macaca mulatta]MOV70955.1 immunoglobulin light chain junction region [Macaca mulatta]
DYYCASYEGGNTFFF